MILHLHFDEDCCVCGDLLHHDIFLVGSDSLDDEIGGFSVERLLDEVETLKSQMDGDYGEDDEEYDADIFAEYGTKDWHSKIDCAVTLVIERHPEWEVSFADMRYFERKIA